MRNRRTPKKRAVKKRNPIARVVTKLRQKRVDSKKLYRRTKAKRDLSASDLSPLDTDTTNSV